MSRECRFGPGWAGPLLLAATVVLLLGACAQPEPVSEVATVAAPSVGSTARVARGEVRGEVVSVPEPTDAEPMLGIRHEDIAIATSDGEAWNMGSMTMPFALAEELDLEGIATGDRVSFTLEVALDAGMAMTVTAVQELDAATSMAWEAPGVSEPGDETPAPEPLADHGGH